MKKEKITPQEAQRIIQQAELENQKKCVEEIKVILDKYGYAGFGTTQPQVIFIKK